MKKLWAAEPVLIIGFFQAALSLAVTFGAKLSVEQVGACLAALSAGLAWFARTQVSPAKKATPQTATPEAAPPESGPR